MTEGQGQEVGGPSLRSLPKIHGRCGIIVDHYIYVSCDDTEPFLELTVSLQVSILENYGVLSTHNHHVYSTSFLSGQSHANILAQDAHEKVRRPFSRFWLFVCVLVFI